VSRHNRERRKARIVAKLKATKRLVNQGVGIVKREREQLEKKARARDAYRASHPSNFPKGERNGPPPSPLPT